MKLLLIALLLCPVISHAQTIHKKDLQGKWYIQRLVQNGVVIEDRADPQVGLEALLKKMRQNPDYTAEDSVAVVAEHNEKRKVMDSIYIAFYNNGQMEMTSFTGSRQEPGDKPITASYTFDEKTAKLTTIEGDDVETFAIALKDRILKMTMEVTGMKIEMDWKK